MSWNTKNLIRRLRGDQRGVVAIIAGFGLVGFVGFAAIVVDVGYLVHAKRVLQASADAAALAGAQDINRGTPSTALTTATNYSSTSGQRNANANLTVTMASGYPQYRYLTSTGISCSNASNANAVAVRQNATVPLFFGKVLGLDTATISASAVAGSAGGTRQPIDVVIVLDTTASMNQDGGVNCTGTKMDCAFEGFRTLLSGFTPSMDHVALMIFPGVTSAAVSQEYDCSTSTPSSSSLVRYNATPGPVYKIVDFSSDYKNVNGTLNTASNLVKAARGGATGCKAGVRAIGGVKTYYRDALVAAKAYLTNTSAGARTGVQKLIILLSDGDANAEYPDYISGTLPDGTQKRYDQCAAGVAVADDATNTGMIVVTIAYNASTSSTGSCAYDTPRISGCEAMRQMASGDDRFYATNTDGSTSCPSANPITNMNAIFQHIGTSVGTGARLLPDNVS